MTGTWKKICKIGVTFAVGANIILAQPAHSIAAGVNLVSSGSKKHLFIDTDAAVCGVVVHGSLQEKCDDNGLMATYYWRHGFVRMDMVGNASASISVTNPKHVNASGEKVKSFSDWKFQDYITVSGTRVVYSKYSDTDVVYKRKTTNKLRISYVVGDSSFIGVPQQAGSFSLSLSVC